MSRPYSTGNAVYGPFDSAVRSALRLSLVVGFCAFAAGVMIGYAWCLASGRGW